MVCAIILAFLKDKLAFLNADSLFDFYIYAQTCKEQPLIGLQALVEKVYMEGNLLMRTLNWIIMDLAFSLWQIVVQTQMGLSSL